MRRQIRVVLDHGARWFGVLRWLEARMQAGLTVLTYHRVLSEKQCEGYPFPSLVMPDSMFAEQVAWLADHAEVLPLSAALDALNRPRSKPLVAITFDDGYWDNFEIVAPILEAKGLRATFFVTSNFVESGELMWFDLAVGAVRKATDDALLSAARAHEIVPPTAREIEENRLRAWIEALKLTPHQRRTAFVEQLAAGDDGAKSGALYRPMRIEQVAALARRGHEIGSHSASHEILPLATDAELEEVLRESREKLQKWIGAPVPGFCYPDGSHDARVVTATGRAGYRYACTTEPPEGLHPRDPLRMGRIDITRTRVTRPGGAFDLVAFRAEVCRLHEAVR
ncbi:MAG TPA: polysaccharide deacetylase family protein [Planctomycetota bacterium]|nr:polysaccharide deacetylase family protein [Planctomycetota bacterium]